MQWCRRAFRTAHLGEQGTHILAARQLAVQVRGFAARAAESTRWRRLFFVALPGVGGASFYVGWSLRGHRDEDTDLNDIELPLVPEPVGHFVHPYESWSWYQRAWFTIKRSAFLAWIFAPFFCASTIVLVCPENPRLREYWLDKMLECMQRAGAAFQKFGQWLSMRPDMFPPDVIATLAKLRSDAPSHSAEDSRRILRAQLGCEVEDLFDEFNEEPVASGSVGQVHRARLKQEYALDGCRGRLRDVAVKVQHPGVVDSAFMDLDILWKVVDWSKNVIHMTMPFNRGEFDEVIQAQMDFTREAFNLQTFSRNFKGERGIRFPKVSPKFVTPEVLIETWAEGRVISNILEDFDNVKKEAKEVASREMREVQSKLCGILYDMSMKMMVRDNFVHGDLHGGNILYSESDDHVTVLDAGLATSLDKQTVAPFGRFLHDLCSGNTNGIVKYLQFFNESKISVNLPDFTRDIQETMNKFMGPEREHPELPINAADMFGEVMFTMQKHCMLLKGDVASTLFTISISEGLIRQLDPTFDVARGALPYIVRHSPQAMLL